jgi:hypothetical protein
MAYPAASPTPAAPSQGSPKHRQAQQAHVDAHPVYAPATARPAFLPNGLPNETPALPQQQAQQAVSLAASLPVAANHPDSLAPADVAGSLATRDRSCRSTQYYWALASNVFSCFWAVSASVPNYHTDRNHIAPIAQKLVHISPLPHLKTPASLPRSRPKIPQPRFCSR